MSVDELRDRIREGGLIESETEADFVIEHFGLPIENNEENRQKLVGCWLRSVKGKKDAVLPFNECPHCHSYAYTLIWTYWPESKGWVECQRCELRRPPEEWEGNPDA